QSPETGSARSCQCNRKLRHHLVHGRAYSRNVLRHAPEASVRTCVIDLSAALRFRCRIRSNMRLLRCLSRRRFPAPDLLGGVALLPEAATLLKSSGTLAGPTGRCPASLRFLLHRLLIQRFDATRKSACGSVAA